MGVPITRRRFLKQAGSVALAAGAGETLLSACGGNGSSSGPITLTYGWWSNGPTKDTLMSQWVESFSKTHPNITVKPEILSWGDYWSKLQTTVAGGNAWDIVGMGSVVAAPYYDQSALLDLSTFSDYQSIASKLNTTGLQLCAWKGKPYALPVGIYVPLLGYNKTLLHKAGIPFPDPTTPMELGYFKEIGQNLSIKSGNQYTQYAINITNIVPWNDLIMMEGGQVYDNIVNPKKITTNTPAGIKGLADWQSLYTENLAVSYAQQTNGAFGAGDIDSLLTNKVAFSRIVLADFNQVTQQNLIDQVGVTPLFAIHGKQVTSGGANGFGIFADSKHPAEAWEFIKWAATDGNKAFGQISDIPANMTYFNQMASYVKPTSFAQTLVAAEKGLVPTVMTPNAQYMTDMNNILTDLANAKITPAQAAQQIQSKGQADISAG
jgi:multiple sugar transport system substrate-binding protein